MKTRRRAGTPAASIHEALRAHFAAPSWAYLDEVRNGTGWARHTTRTADALAMSLWPSRGLELHGIEIKSERADWMRELHDPEKGDAIGKYCDRFWLAVGDASVAAPGELPAPWGLMVFDDGKMTVVKVAEKLEAKPLDRLLLAAILRRAVESMADSVPRTAIVTESAALVEAAREEGHSEALADYQHACHAHEALLAQVRAFEKAAGVQIGVWNGQAVGKAVAALTHHTPEELRTSYTHLRNIAARIQEDADAVLAALLGEKTDEPE